MIRFFKQYWLLAVITLLAGVLRFYQLPSQPPALNWDEVSHGYNAYSLIQTGKDEWGKSFPLIFRAFGDFKLPLYIYLTILPVWAFGLSPLGVRFISALAGTLAIPGIYLLTNALFKTNSNKEDNGTSTNAGVIAAFLLALTPWHFFISRPALEANLSLTFFIFGAYFLLKSLKNPNFYLPASLLLSLTLHTYNTYRIFTPIFIIGFFAIYRPKIKLNAAAIASSVLILLSLGLVGSQVLDKTGTARYAKLSILSENAVYQIGQNRSQSSLPDLAAKLLYNRPLYFASQVTKNYLTYFSLPFLYQAQGSQSQFAIPGKNLLSLPITILAIWGFIIAIKKSKTPSNQLLIFWLLISPIAASLTNDPPQALRPTPMIPVAVLLAVIGTLSMYLLVKSYLYRLHPRFFWLYLFTVMVIAFGRYLHTYFTDYPKFYSQSWQYGYQQVYDYLAQNQAKYDRVFVTKGYGEPHIFYAFFNNLDPNKLQTDTDSKRFFQSDWYWTDRIDNVYFVNNWQIPNSENVLQLPLESGEVVSTKKSLLITTPDHLPDNVFPVKTFDFLDGQLGFVIAEFR